MVISKNEWKHEEERVSNVYEKVKEELNERKCEMDSFRRDVISIRKAMWENANHSIGNLEEAIDAKQYMDTIVIEESKHHITQQVVRKLERLILSPYFARIDFIEEDRADPENIYIGISTFIDDETNEILIYDWRAPISSMLYDYELGFARYQAHIGEIEGTVSLKRQFKISKFHIDYMFDNSIKIDDDVLQKILSENVDDKMRSIVTTIQKEQNSIIRNEENDLLIVQGVAGSGKTSIALHRVAYLLYKYRDDKITANNIVIFSPNSLFNDYISNVLPELGEENMRQTTFLEFAESMIEPDWELEDMNEQIEYLLSSSDEDDYEARVNGIQYKTSHEFLQVIKKYITYLEGDGLHFRDIFHRGKLIISKEEIFKIFHNTYNNWPLIRRLNKIKRIMLSRLAPVRKERLEEIRIEVKQKKEYEFEVEARSRLIVYQEFKKIRDEIDELTRMDVYEVYANLFEDENLFKKFSEAKILSDQIDQICLHTLKMIKNKFISYEDLSAFIYLKGELEGLPTLIEIKHVVIDEAQDYTPIQYAIFKKKFSKSSFTLLGDLNQTIHPYIKTTDYERVTDIFKASRSVILNLYKSYRSTKDIVEFSRAILPDGESVQPIDRVGERPRIIEISPENETTDIIFQDINDLIDHGYQSMAIICKTADESLKVFNKLKDEIDVTLITKDDDEFNRGIVVIPSYLSKGLEFDAVLIYDASENKYCCENERNLFYTICTRALHKLYIYYKGEVSYFVPDIK
ncbi:MAG: UvrD-helicase domain-containing protein [Halanaerobiales bacterium]|nr:UvrD-helicase domain-containing protein [Halanaerobiales bacterium]